MEKINEPTKEQIEALWEWCGLKKGTCGWLYDPDKPAMPIFPELTLNNLFNYAVPILQDKGSQVEILGFEHKGYRATVYEDGFFQDGAGSFEPFIQPKSQVDNNDPALALFWAIYEAMHHAN